MAPMLLLCSFLLLAAAVECYSIPTTLDGPFRPTTIPYDCFLRNGSDDVPETDARLQRRKPVPYPEQISLAIASPDSMWVSWVSGDYQIGENVVQLNTSLAESVVVYGTEKGNYDFTAYGEAVVYSQLYTIPGTRNYTSGYINHVRLTGLKPSTKYYYRCGQPHAMSDELEFITFPHSSPTDYPGRIAIVGDLGLSYNTSTTIDHMIKNEPSMLLLVGDFTYSDQYSTMGVPWGQKGTLQTYQPHWDNWGRFMEPLISKIPMMVIEGNHDIELQPSGKMFESYKSRYVVSDESNSGTSLYYSFNAGGIHFVMLGAYVDYNRTGEQYKWLKNDLERVNRSVTPWLIATWHPPWYNSYRTHYREVECMRIELEDLLYQHRVDVVFNGHVHAYERSNRVYRYELDECAPLYITVGDGGNFEAVQTVHADEPDKCPKPGTILSVYGGVCATNFTSGPAAGQYCWNRQPDWSALRDGSFGHGILEVKNATHALWTWYRNQDVYGRDHVGDQIYIVRQPYSCGLNDKVQLVIPVHVAPPSSPSPSPSSSPSPSPSSSPSPDPSFSPSPSPSSAQALKMLSLLPLIVINFLLKSFL